MAAEREQSLHALPPFLFQFPRPFVLPSLATPVIVAKEHFDIPPHILQLIKLRFLITDLTLHLLSLSPKFLLFCSQFLLIEMGFSAVAIADRLGHESIDITYRYAHLFPTKQKEIAEKLNVERGEDDVC